jgi:hypothetical protein
MGQQTDLEQSIMRTVLWFSLFEYPLTVFEIWKWLLAPQRAYGLGEVYAVLEGSQWLGNKLETHEGFLALKGKGIHSLIVQRQTRFLDAERKFALLRRSAKYFYLLPGVRAVGVVNTMAWWSTKPQSDIDLYIVTRPGHIWSSRFWLVLPFLLSGRRPHHGEDGHGGKDPFCFSFFSTTEQLGLGDLSVSRDVYMRFWIRSLVPVFDRDGSLGEFQAQNRWVTHTLPNARARIQHHHHEPRRLPSAPIQWKIAEPIFRLIQRSRLPVALREIANLDSRVVVSDDMLKFHDNDRREQYRDAYETLVGRHLC